MKISGHPIHIILIHFPSALFPVDLVFSCLAAFTGNEILGQASGYVLIAGVLVGWLAVMTGLFDVAKIPEKKSHLTKKALIHGGINTLVLIVYTLFAFPIYKRMPAYSPDQWHILIIKALLVLLMVIGNFIGGDLVLKDKVLEDK